MRLLGFDIQRAKASPPAGLQAVSDRGWWPVIREAFPGAWQRNIEVRQESVLTYHAVYACVTLIAADISKMRLRLVEDEDGIWSEMENTAYSPVLRKPNHYQNRIKFFEHWIVSKLLNGNTYILKGRDNRNVVTSLYVLDPKRTKPLVTPAGDVYYQLSQDNLSDVAEQTVVPASEIIHDVMVPLFHPLCGVSPLTACGLAAVQGISIQTNSAKFFQNGAQPSGILTAPGTIDDEEAKRFKEDWNTNYTGQNAGKIAVLSGGLKYEAVTMTALDADLINQLKMTAEIVCSAFHVPPYMIGVGPAPTYNNIEALNAQYYAQCLQALIESIELLLDEGLGLPKNLGTEFDLDDLLRMDTATQIKTWGDAVKGTILAPNEARKKLGYKPVAGGDAPLSQQQNFSLEALAKRDAKDDPFESMAKPQAIPADKPAANNDNEDAANAAAFLGQIRKGLTVHAV